ncbi:MAG: zinc metallopeptidase [Bacteroidales bacterium]|nr:zinc metallopeptidase [Candidatus Cryptobacteroides onthequi]MCQ2163930.1 zinc metallopeptidase [Bacteroidales bacterium]
MIWTIMIAIMIVSYIIQAVLNSKFEKYSQILNPGGLTGAEVAAKMLQAHGITNVKVTCIDGQLTDHFNPLDMTVNLSREVYTQRSVAAAAIAAHECGHAVQHAVGYAPVKLRSALVPVVSFSSKWVSWVLLAGVLLIQFTPSLLWLGIALFAMSTLFSFVTLPVEINASSRAIKWLDSNRIAYGEAREQAVDALKWAAYTYVIAALGSLATLLYYVSIASRRD